MANFNQAMPRKLPPCINKLLMTCLVNLERIKPFSCDICDKLYCHKESLTNHLTTHIKKEEIDTDIHHTTKYGEHVTSKNILDCSSAINVGYTLNTTKSEDDIHTVTRDGLLPMRDRIKFETEDTIDTAIRASCAKIATAINNNTSSISQDPTSSSSSKYDLVPVAHINLKSSYGKLYQCKICNENFAHHSSLELHGPMHHNKSQQISADPLKQIPLVDIQKQMGTKHICDICRKVFPSDHQLSLHSKFHDSWQCNMCEKTFKLQMHLKRHERSMHTNYQPYSCVPCNVYFKHYSSFAYHYRKKHMPEEEQPTCDLCNKRCPIKQNLERHILSVHMTKGYRCRICKTKKEYGHPINLAKHMYTHNGYLQCKYCRKTFTQKCHMERHVKLIHEKILNFECDMCRKKFGRKEHLLQHITNKCCLEPYKRRKCKRSNSKLADLKKHKMKCKKKVE